MKNFCLGLLLVLAPTMWARADFLYKGYITHTTDESYFIKDEYTNKTFRVLTRIKSIWNQLQTLDTGDYISGSAYNESSEIIYLTSIDFAGIKKILGFWKSDKLMVHFEDFNNVYFWNLEGDKFVGPYHYDYTTSPEEDGHLSIYFADDDKVQLTTLVFKSFSKIQLIFFDNDTGAITHTYDLERP